MRIGGIRADAQCSWPIFNKQLIDLVIFEVFFYLDDTINNNDDNVQEVEKNTEVCRDLFMLWLVLFIFQDASYNLRMVIFNRLAFRQRCSPNLIQSIIPPPGGASSNRSLMLQEKGYSELISLVSREYFPTLQPGNYLDKIVLHKKILHNFFILSS